MESFLEMADRVSFTFLRVMLVICQMEMEVGKSSRFLQHLVMKTKTAGGLDCCCRREERRRSDCERWSDSGYLLEVKPIFF